MSRSVAETEVAREARIWLEGRGLETFAEVEFRDYRIDLVGRSAGLVVAVECKVSFGLAVLEQASRWRDWASETWVCVPRWSARRSAFGEEVCRSFGLGLLRVDPETWRPPQVGVEAARRDPKGAEKLHRALYEEQKDSAAGGNGGHSTKFRRTVSALVETVRAEPGLTLREALAKTPHHYSSKASAVSTLGALLRRTGKLRPIELASIRLDDSRPARLLLADSEDF